MTQLSQPPQGIYVILPRTFRYRWSLLGILCTSCAAAVLWGTNLGTIYPIVDVVLQRQSLNEWVHRQIATSRKRILELQTQIEELSRTNSHSTAELARIRQELATEQRAVARAQWLKPWIERYLPDDPFAVLKVIVAVLLLGTLLKSIFLVLNLILVERVAQQVTFDLRNELYGHTLAMDMGFFGRERTSQLLSLFTYDVESILGALRTILGRAILEPLKILACLVGAACICWRLLILSLVITPIAFFVTQRLMRRVKKANHRSMDQVAGLYNRLTESLQGILLVKASNMERHEQRRFRAQGRQIVSKAMRIAFFQAIAKPSNELFSMAIIGLALLAGGYLVLYEETHLLGVRMCSRPLGFGALMTFFAFLAGISDPFRKLIDVTNQIQQGLAAADRVEGLQRQRPRIVDRPDAKKLDSALRELQLRDVHFSYPGCPPVLQGMSLTIKAGETVALVGPNGSGKSTIFNLLLRLYDPDTGQVLWNEQDLRDIRQADLRRAIGLVTQHAVLFDESIMDNIRYGRPAATDEEVTQAAKKAHAHEFIQSQLPQGYATRAGTAGKLLSGGQRQRIVLARAILRDPQLLLLDEATSQIDLESERLIQKSLEQFRVGRTTVLIAHRPETMILADRILVLEGGRIAAEGAHEELLRSSSFYSRLYRSTLQAAV